MSVMDSWTEDFGDNFAFGQLNAPSEELNPSPYDQLTETLRAASLLSSMATGNSESAAKVAPAPAPAPAEATAKQVCLLRKLVDYITLCFHTARLERVD